MGQEVERERERGEEGREIKIEMKGERGERVFWCKESQRETGEKVRGGGGRGSVGFWDNQDLLERETTLSVAMTTAST